MSRVLNIIAMLIVLLSVVAVIFLTVMAFAFSTDIYVAIWLVIGLGVVSWAWFRVLNNQRG